MTTEEQADADSAERPALVSPKAEDRGSEAKAARLAREKPAAAEPKREKKTIRRKLGSMKHASQHLKELALGTSGVQPKTGGEADDESAANPIFDAARWRNAEGLR